MVSSLQILLGIEMMSFTYGPGQFIHGDVHAEGEIILSEYKLYLRKDGKELASTYIPLDKMVRMKRDGKVLSVFVKLSVSFNYWAQFIGETSKIKELVKDLAEYRGFKKKFLRDEWEEVLS